MRAPTQSLIACWIVAACSGQGSMGTCPEPEPWPDEFFCASAAKLALSCAGRPLPEAECPQVVFPLLSWAMNNRSWEYLLLKLTAENFTFVDETTGISTRGRAHEDSLIQRNVSPPAGFYRAVEFDFQIDSYETNLVCHKACGMIRMRLYLEHDSGFIVNDETCLTICPRAGGDLWFLSEWRIVRSVPLGRIEEGFELATWGQVKNQPPQGAR